MRLGDRGRELIKRYEGCSLKAYQDTGGVWTIGYGHTKTAARNKVISHDEAERLFDADVKWAVDAVNNRVPLALNQSQFDAIVSFVFNAGESAFAKSTLLREINNGNLLYAPRELTRWVHDNGRALKGLARRRVAEAALFLED